tara:strand:+ start:1285 stop:1389 length:105 start_codon:yes stop_codon:yes gene_type:complete
MEKIKKIATILYYYIESKVILGIMYLIASKKEIN